MERTTVLPPLLQRVVAARDVVDWGPPTRMNPNTTMRTAEVPFCKGVVTRLTIIVPDVHTSVCAAMFNANSIGSIVYADNDRVRHLGPLPPSQTSTDGPAGGTACGTAVRPSPSGGDPARPPRPSATVDGTAPGTEGRGRDDQRGLASPATIPDAAARNTAAVPDKRSSRHRKDSAVNGSGSSVARRTSVAELKAARDQILSLPGQWFFPHDDLALTAFESAVFMGGGVAEAVPSCPSWFPDCNPKRCPISNNEVGMYTKLSSGILGTTPRDFAYRAVLMLDLSLRSRFTHLPDIARDATSAASRTSLPDMSESDLSAPSTVAAATAGEVSDDSATVLLREAAGLTPQFPEVYIGASCSASGLVPALRNTVRGGICNVFTFQGLGNGETGCTLDLFLCIELIGNSLTQKLTINSFISDSLFFIALARRLQKKLDDNKTPMPVDVAAPENYRMLKEISSWDAASMNQSISAAEAAASGCGSQCTVQ